MKLPSCRCPTRLLRSQQQSWRKFRMTLLKLSAFSPTAGLYSKNASGAEKKIFHDNFIMSSYHLRNSQKNSGIGTTINTRFLMAALRHIKCHNLPTERARELSKPSKAAESFVGLIKKIRELLLLNFLGVTSRMGKSRDFWMTSSGPDK